MKTRPVSMFTLITLLIGCSTIEQQKNDLMEMNLNGKVKSIRVFMYEAIEKSGEIKVSISEIILKVCYFTKVPI